MRGKALATYSYLEKSFSSMLRPAKVQKLEPVKLMPQLNKFLRRAYLFVSKACLFVANMQFQLALNSFIRTE